ncbi:MAG: hypothetical protein MZV49_07760 [Rhodopseudomonas palustris]|nr:hypothetical protein [Rhodopseudomonas palustris]
MKAPQAMISLREVNSYRYFVGKVAKPGMYESRAEVTLQAISMAGGLLDGVDLAQAYVARGTQRVPVDFVRLRQGPGAEHHPIPMAIGTGNPRRDMHVGESPATRMLPFVKERNWTVTKAVATVGSFHTTRGQRP